MNKCIFCEIIKNKSNKIIYENDNLIVLPDINPKSDVHLLIISKKHIENLYHIKQEHRNMLGDMLLIAPELAKLKNIKDGFRIVINNGEKSKQEIYHLHFHFLGYR